MTAPLEVMLDSGAYTAWTKERRINLQDYFDFIVKYKDIWTTVISLDVIPGRYGGPPPTAAEAERAADEGWDNYYQLTDALKPYGITPIHTFHRGDNFKHLERLVKECEFFCLAPKTFPRSTALRAAWLDTCMPYVTKEGRPLRKMHGLGVGVPELIARYPWYSVDTSSWQQTGRFGSCYIPINGKVYKIPFSAKSRHKPNHWDKLSTDPEAFAAYIKKNGVAIPVDWKRGKRIFFAGNTGTSRVERILIARGARRRLLSFAHVEHNFEKAYLPVYREAMTM